LEPLFARRVVWESLSWREASVERLLLDPIAVEPMTRWGMILAPLALEPLMSKLKRLERFARWLTWCAVLALAILSWTPAEDMVRPGWGHHLTAYFISGAVAALGYGRRRGCVTVGVLLCGYAGILEIGQNWSPGRSPAFDDFAASSMGTLLGTTLVWLWFTYLARGRPTFIDGEPHPRFTLLGRGRRDLRRDRFSLRERRSAMDQRADLADVRRG
jgi:VanZ family protein